MKLFRATLLVSFASLLSRVLGIIRENLLATHFGGIQTNGSNPLDAYYAAFRIPDFLYNLVIMSVGAAIFVPIFSRELKRNQNQINQVVNNFMNVAMIILLLGCGIVYLVMPWFLDGLTLGFSSDNKLLTEGLMRVMLLSPIFFGLSSIVGSYLSVYKDFTAYIWSPIVYNLSIIVGILLLVPHFGVYGVAYGVVLGALLHLCVQWYPLFKRGYRYVWTCSFTSPYIAEVKKLVLPRIIGISASQLNLIVDTVIASTLASGSLTILNWTQNMQALPSGLIGISISITAFTVLSDLAMGDAKEKFSQTFIQTLRMIIFLSIPLTVGFFLLREGVIDLIFNYGKFTQGGGENFVVTSNTLGIFILSLLFQGVIPLLTRAYYAYQDTRTPVLVTVCTVGMNIVLSLFFVHVLMMGVMGLAFSFTIANTFNALLLLYFLNKKVLQYRLQLKHMNTFLIRVIGMSLCMGGWVFIIYRLFSMLGNSKWLILGNLLITSISGAIVFFWLAYITHIEEVRYVLSKIKIPFARHFKDR